MGGGGGGLGTPWQISWAHENTVGQGQASLSGEVIRFTGTDPDNKQVPSTDPHTLASAEQGAQCTPWLPIRSSSKSALPALMAAVLSRL